MNFHPTAVIAPDVKLGADVHVGPYAVIEEDVVLGDHCRIAAHAVIKRHTRLGARCRVAEHAVIGGDPQDFKFKPDILSYTEIGEDNYFREGVTIHRGSRPDSVTRIGNGCFLMAYAHIAHDCIVGNHTIFANAASLAGHVTVDDWVILGGFTLVHQFCQIGAHAFTSMGSIINRDVPPYVTVAGSFAEPKGINSEGLRRRGYDTARIMAIKRAYKTLYKSGFTLAEARGELARAADGAPDVRLMLDFIERSQRSLVR